MKTKKKITQSILFGALIAFGVQSAFGMTPSASGGRLAYVADGNSRDPDDIGANSALLAILRATGLENKLVHCSHSCDLVDNDSLNAQQRKMREGLMQDACDDTAAEWGGYGHLTFWNCITQETQTVNNLVAAINVSTATNPLHIAQAGEPDILYFALEQSNANRHRHVTILSHHTANDNGDFHTAQQIRNDFNVNYVYIPDQNPDFNGPISGFFWARDHADSRINEVWKHVKIAEQDGLHPAQNNKWDISDAGMAYYWATGVLEPNVNQLRNLLEDWVADNPQGGGNPGNGGNNFVRIFKRNHPDFCIDAGGGPGMNGQNVRLFTYGGFARQEWNEISRGNGFFSYVRRGTNHAIDGGDGGANNQNVRLWQMGAGNQNQHWKKVAVGQTGYFRLRKRNSINFTIDGGAGAGDLQNVTIKTYSALDHNQHWNIQ